MISQLWPTRRGTYDPPAGFVARYGGRAFLPGVVRIMNAPAAICKTYAVDGRADRIIHYCDTGGDRTAVVFLHGLGGNSKVWQPFIREGGCCCDSHGVRFRAICVDLLGHGQSSKPGNFDYSMSGQAKALGQLIDACGISQFVVIGASYGGGVAAELARDKSIGEDGTSLLGMVLIAGAGLYFAPPPRIRYARNPLLRWWLENCGTARLVARILLEGSFYRPERVPRQLIEDIAAPLRLPGARRAIRLAALEMFDELAARRADQSRYACVQCPTLLVWGEHDGTVPRDVMSRLMDTIPHSRGEIVADCGHTPHEECPDRLNMLLCEFLSELN